MPIYGISVDRYGGEDVQLPNEVAAILGFNPPVYPRRDSMWLIIYPTEKPLSGETLGDLSSYGIGVEEFELV